MPGFLVHSGALVICSHFGLASSPSPYPRVLVSGQPVTVQPVPYVVSGCGLGATSSPPCVTANWTTAALRVMAGGMPVLLQSSSSVCVPTGTPLTVVLTQMRVTGT